jgi:SagB-type dehydrogenase family enzyme
MTCHEQTNHSYLSVRKNATFLDWRTQPKSTKHYPHFYPRYRLEEYDQLAKLDLIGGRTYQHTYPEGTRYLRTTPSAGGLYPCEVYLQTRSTQGLMSGIYHYEPLNAALSLLCEVDQDGVEFYFPDQHKHIGLTFLISTVYFRSAWKYHDRAIRYILLDSGHQLGAIYAALCVMEKRSRLLFSFDKEALAGRLGIGDNEMLTCAITASDRSDKICKKPKIQLPYVCGSDYHETSPFIEKHYAQSADYQTEDISDPGFFDTVDKDELQHAITQRRSTRAFYGTTLPCESFHFITRDLFTFAAGHDITIHYTLHDVADMEQGLYKNEQLIKNGNFRSKSRYLALEQNLGGQSSVTLYLTSGAQKTYQKATILCGFITHIIYLRCQLKGVGCSGIGAYYDEEAQVFLETDENILYMVAIGK